MMQNPQRWIKERAERFASGGIPDYISEGEEDWWSIRTPSRHRLELLREVTHILVVNLRVCVAAFPTNFERIFYREKQSLIGFFERFNADLRCSTWEGCAHLQSTGLIEKVGRWSFPQFGGAPELSLDSLWEASMLGPPQPPKNLEDVEDLRDWMAAGCPAVE